MSESGEFGRDLIDSEQALKDAREVLEKYGHLRLSEGISLELQDALVKNRFNVGQLESLCTRIRAGDLLGTDADNVLKQAADFGLKNFSGVHVGKGVLITDKDFSGVSFRDAVFSNDWNSVFFSCNLSHADFRGASIGRMGFRYSDLYAADFSTIRIQGTEVDLLEGGLELKNEDLWEVRKNARHFLGVCENAEVYNKQVLSEVSELSREGVVLFQEEKPIAYMKSEAAGNTLVLALRTVKNKFGEVILWKGMLYTVQKDLQDHLRTALRKQKTKGVWLRADVEALAKLWTQKGHPHGLLRNNMRFVNDPQLFQEISKLAQGLESGEEPCQNIYD